MRHATTLLILFLLALPASAAWQISATQVTWQASAPTADVAELRAAVEYERDTSSAYWGGLILAAYPALGVTNNGDGTSTISMTWPRTPAEAWVLLRAAEWCPGASSTNQERLACVDARLKQDFKAALDRYRTATVVPPETAPDLVDP